MKSQKQFGSFSAVQFVLWFSFFFIFLLS